MTKQNKHREERDPIAYTKQFTIHDTAKFNTLLIDNGDAMRIRVADIISSIDSPTKL